MTHPLINITSVDPRIRLDLRYATTNNFCHQQLYTTTTCFLHKDCAHALKRVQDRLAPKGLFLKIFDGYRPLAVQKMMWDLYPDENYVMNPATGKGRHTCGTAVDLTLADATGHELEMPSDFDDFTERAHRDNPLHSKAARENMKILEDAMEAEGFIGWPFEWWHYDLKNWENDTLYPALDITLESLTSSKAPMKGF